MVKELILDNDRVVLPGLGCFVAELVPATFSDKGYTINPPYRRLYFRSKPDEGDELVKFYAQSNNVPMEMADRIITDFVAELKSVLHLKKTIVFPGLGRLRATKENNVFFVADEELDIYPDGFGLEPISLKTNQETPEEVSAAVEGLKSLLDDTASQHVSELEIESEVESTVETEPEPEESTSEPEPEVEEKAEEEDVVVTEEEEKVINKPKRKGLKKFFLTIFILLLIAAVLLCAFGAVGRLYPELIDPLLYTEDELAIINYIL